MPVEVKRRYEPMRLTRHAFAAMSKYSGVAINTRAPAVPTTVITEIDGCDVGALARRFGSPLCVVSEARLRTEFRELRKAFRAVYPDTEIAYSYKTNYLTGIRAVLHEEVFDAPFAFRIAREPNPHIGFGMGEHVCLGAHLARLELRHAFGQLRKRLEQCELAGPVERVCSSFVGGIKRAPMRWQIGPDSGAAV